MEIHRLSPEDVGGVREAFKREDRGPRILCWNCKKLTPFQEERCLYCGARFAGGTGGVYASPRPAARTSSPSRPAARPKDDLAEARRSLIELFEDLQRVHDVSSVSRYDTTREEESVTLFQCPSCGRFVSEEAAECLCGVRFADSSALSCPECGSMVRGADGVCPVCRARVGETTPDVVYACPRCGAEVAADALQCSCGARFEA